MRKILSSYTVYVASIIGFLFGYFPASAFAQDAGTPVYGGAGITGGIETANTIIGISSNGIAGTVTNLMYDIVYFMALAAVVAIVYSGISLVVSVGDDAAKDKAKKTIGYALGGLVIIFLAGGIVSFIIGSTGAGTLFGTPPGGTTDIYATVLNIVFAVLKFMGLAAVVVIVIAGISLVVSVGDDAAKDKAKKTIGYAVAGLVIIFLAGGIVDLLIGATGAGSLFGTPPGSVNIRANIISILKEVLTYMGLAGVVSIVIAGIMLVVSGGEESTKDRAKKIILYTVVGLIVILLASAIVTLVESTLSAS